MFQTEYWQAKVPVVSVLLGVPPAVAGVLVGVGDTRGTVVALLAEIPVYLGVQAYLRRFGPARAPHLRGPVVTHQIGESIWLPHDVDPVWQLIRPPERAPGLNANVATAYRVLGRPEGLGERQAFVDLEGRTTVVEVVEYVPGRKVVTVPVPPIPGRLRAIERVDPEGTGCRLTVENEYEAPQGVVRTDAEIQVWRQHHRAYLAQVAEVLASDALRS